MFRGKKILITGGTGSLGTALTSRLLNEGVDTIRIFSRNENKQIMMESKFKDDRLRFLLGDIRDYSRLVRAMEDIDIVFHAAALKHVPIIEYNPFEAVKTNIMGGQNVIDASLYCGVEKVIALSTDKAAAPINLYGATKLTSDKLFIAANNYTGGHDIKFSVVRYGNVMGSRGSVIPFFLNKKGDGVIPITDERMTRFNITLQEGVDFVIDSFERMWGGELFVPKIPSYRITDIAEAIATGIPTRIVGIRPGEKLHEEMIATTDALNCIEFENYYAIMPSTKLWDIEKFRKESNRKIGSYCKTGFAYNSETNSDFLSVDDLRHLIKERM